MMTSPTYVAVRRKRTCIDADDDNRAHDWRNVLNPLVHQCDS